MARRKQGARPAFARPQEIRVRETEGETEGETEEQTEEERAAEDTLQDIADASPRDPYAVIKVVRPDSPELRYLDRVSARLVGEQWIAKNYGGGTYHVQFYKPSGRGSKMIYDKNRIYEVDPTVPPRVPPWLRSANVGGSDSAPEPIAPTGSRRQEILDAGLLQLFQMMGLTVKQVAESNSTMDKLLPVLLGRDTRPSFDVAAFATAISPVIVALISTMGSRRDPAEVASQLITSMRAERPEAPLDPLDAIERAAKLLKSQSGPASGVSDIIGVLRDLGSLRELLGDASQSDPMLSLVQSMGPKVLDIIGNLQKQEVRQPIPRLMAAPPAIPSTTTPSTPSDQTPTPQHDAEPDMSVFDAVIRHYAPEMLTLARAGKDPVLYAELALDNIPETFRGVLAEHAKRDSFIEDVLARHPPLREYELWCFDFLGVIQDAYTRLHETDDDPDDGGESAITETVTAAKPPSKRGSKAKAKDETT